MAFRPSSIPRALRTTIVIATVGFASLSRAAEMPTPLASPIPGQPVSATADGDSGGASFSGDGRWVLFSSTADNLVTNCHNGLVVDLYIRDLAAGTVSLISATPDNRNGGNAHTYQGTLSDDGRFIVFESLASNLVDNDDDERVDYFLRDRLAGTTVRISPPSITDVPPKSDLPLVTPLALAGDGSRAAFVRGGQLYVYERATGHTTLLTRAWNGPEVPVAGEADSPQFAADGSRLAFRSTAANLVRPPASNLTHPLQLYVYRFQPGAINPTNLTQVRLTNAQLPIVVGGYPVAEHSLSDDGRFLVAALSPPPGVPNANFGIYRFDLAADKAEHLTPSLTLTPNSSLSLAAAAHSPVLAFQVQQGSAAPQYTNGLFVWTPSGGLVLQKVLLNGQLRPLIASPLEFDAEGSQLLFTSSVTNVVSGLADARSRHFLREISSGQTVLATDDSDGASAVSLNPDGTRVVFESGATTLTENDLNQASDVFVRPLAGGDPILLTPRVASEPAQTAGGATALAGSAFSADGRFLVFTSVADDLIAGDANGAGDVFVRDQQTGELRLVSVDRDGIASGNGHSGQPVISADGRWVAFISAATNLVTGDANGRPDVFERDLQTGVTVLVSSRANGTSGSGPIVAFAMSQDGREFVFQGRNTDLTGAGLTGDRIYLRTLPDGAVKAISTTGVALAPTMSADGSVAGFVLNGLARLFQVATGTSQTLAHSAAVLATESVTLNADGSRVILLNTEGSLELFQRNADGSYSAKTFPTEPSPKRRVKEVTLSPDGRWLTYVAVPPGSSPFAVGGNLGYDIYVRDLSTGVEERINRSYLGGRGNGDSDQPALSLDARYVVFRSNASDLVPDDDNGEGDIFIYDRTTGRTRLVTRQPQTTAPLAGRSYRGRFGADSAAVWLHTFASEVVSGDFNAAPEAMRFPLEPDTDADGLDDSWELANFGNLNESGSGDFDQDSVSNADEWAAGTLPKDAASSLQVALETRPDETQFLSWPTVPGKRYRVLMTTTLTPVDAVPWRTAGTVLTATGTTLRFQVPSGGSESEKFFALAVAP